MMLPWPNTHVLLKIVNMPNSFEIQTAIPRNCPAIDAPIRYPKYPSDPNCMHTNWSNNSKCDLIRCNKYDHGMDNTLTIQAHTHLDEGSACLEYRTEVDGFLWFNVFSVCSCAAASDDNVSESTVMEEMSMWWLMIDDASPISYRYPWRTKWVFLRLWCDGGLKAMDLVTSDKVKVLRSRSTISDIYCVECALAVRSELG